MWLIPFFDNYIFWNTVHPNEIDSSDNKVNQISGQHFSMKVLFCPDLTIHTFHAWSFYPRFVPSALRENVLVTSKNYEIAFSHFSQCICFTCAPERKRVSNKQKLWNLHLAIFHNAYVSHVLQAWFANDSSCNPSKNK